MQYVLTGLDNDQIDVSSNKSFRLLTEAITHRVEFDVAEGGQLGCWPHGSGHESWFFRRAVLISNVAGQLRSTTVEFKGLIFKTVFSKNDGGCPKRVGFDHVAAHV